MNIGRCVFELLSVSEGGDTVAEVRVTGQALSGGENRGGLVQVDSWLVVRLDPVTHLDGPVPVVPRDQRSALACRRTVTATLAQCDFRSGSHQAGLAGRLVTSGSANDKCCQVQKTTSAGQKSTSVVGARARISEGSVFG